MSSWVAGLYHYTISYPRSNLVINSNTPGTEIATETAAAMAASSIVFRSSNRVWQEMMMNVEILIDVTHSSYPRQIFDLYHEQNILLIVFITDDTGDYSTSFAPQWYTLPEQQCVAEMGGGVKVHAWSEYGLVKP
ncbi:hypothetical protein RJT34_17664 [Clitoria ternatea]|uniref:Uncharacterized protein n=1 Tax=Clitoria ternatea TaxID=43366 RepID=A0AAN9PDH7_CLITE